MPFSSTKLVIRGPPLASIVIPTMPLTRLEHSSAICQYQNVRTVNSLLVGFSANQGRHELVERPDVLLVHIPVRPGVLLVKRRRPDERTSSRSVFSPAIQPRASGQSWSRVYVHAQLSPDRVSV